MTDLVWTNCTVRLGDLKPWEHNPRQSTRAQAKRILASFEKFGQVAPVAIDPDNQVLDGHQRLSALLTIHGADYEIAARRSSRPLTDDERRGLVLAMANATGGWDWDRLSGWNTADLNIWGFDADTLNGWKKDVTALGEFLKSEQPAKDAEPQVDRAAELLEKWQVKAGDLWKIGGHRLICGDCTDAVTVGRVMGGERADMVFTDPPWNVDYQGGTKKREELANDDIEVGWDEWLTDALRVIPAKDNAPAYVFFGLMRAGDTQHGIEAAGWRIVQTLVWVKQHAQFGNFRAHYKYQHEPMYYCSIGKKVPAFYGANNEVSVWAHDRASRNDNHPTEKPIDVAAHGIKNSSKEGEIVFDGFLGGGTSMVACQNLSRRCRAVEISPAYVAVALERMATAFPELSIKRLE